MAGGTGNFQVLQEMLGWRAMRSKAKAGLVGMILSLIAGPAAVWAQGMMEAVPKPSPDRWSPPSSLVLPEASVPNSAAPPSIPQRNNELTLPSLTNQRASIAPPPKSDSTRVIPVIPPNQEVLVLPQASRDFLGSWGGGLTLVTKFGPSNPPEHPEMSFVFGDRGGQVVLATTVFASPDTQVLKTSADSDGPDKVKLEVAAINLGSDPPVRHVEKLTFELAAPNQVRVTRRVDFYVSGYSGPAAEAVYEGTLAPMSIRESQMITDEMVRRTGKVPRATINEGNAPPLPPD